ncbi:uncharacterized protein E5676_scaffold447G00790 [Cucumis melo var. makuwa]|uniref:Gag-pol polyprotein n=1 Tax=Cucumis melo var. makuwa TaxID=1194695 RepID=A0A5A7SHZ6_CUCMM|nr:uncharacterized protein E6C27_scaffold34G00270 [Cucumis melo var. makuwa]TYK09675.1 uncharacterized protein E5676_scaffold447G00790 [Cucumis melo var. makuwa]
MSIDFSDEDLLLGSKLHNRLLYVSEYVREQRVDQILIDNGSAANIMSKSTMRQLDILMDKLSNSKLVIQGFNLGSQRVIDGVKKVEADFNPFSEAESHFADVKRHDVILSNPEKEDLEQGEGETSCHHITILEELQIETPEEDVEDAPQSLKDGGQSTVDELKEVNLGTIKEPRPIFISASLSSEKEDKYMSLLTKYKDIFAWLYKEMPGLDPKVAVYHLAIKLGY